MTAPTPSPAPGAPTGGEPSGQAPQGTQQPPATPPAQQGQQQTGQEPNQQQGGTTGQQQDDVASLPEWAQKQIRDLRTEAAGNRTKAKETEQTHQQTLDAIAKALGLKQDEPPDPAKLAEELTNERSSRRQALVELAVFKTASKQGADPDALADSRAFMSALDKLDPTAEDFAAKLSETIKKAVQDNPKLKTGQAPAGQSGGDFSGGTGDKSAPQSVDDFRKARSKWRSGAP
ncbi:hypothetical protein [Amycolatopsis taiwanensis]|uniref:hypothetical protein n=1 Tax=Amycolatopsis taiwanensis TaxID=342230 RepID=UPI0004AC9191|nr:hypothetical protein [Amycolatopsis taiwanensis]